MTIAPTPSPASSSIEHELEALASLALQRERRDLAARMASAKDRVSRPETIVAVVGEFKQGKSSIVNGLLGEAICPVDDDIATATLTILHHGDAAATVWRHSGGELKGHHIAVSEVDRFVTERTNPGNRAEIALIEVKLPNSFLGRGIALVDTPGVGGLSAGYMGMTLSYLHAADATLFVTDASAPLSSAEVEFLKLAAERCSQVTVVLSKIDLFPDWRRVAEIDRETLAAEGIRADLVPLSSVLRAEAFARRDAELNAESGYPELLDLVARSILDPSRERATQRAREEAAFVADQLLASLAPELAALDDPTIAADTIRDLDAQRERLDRLRAGSARWQLLLNDQFGDVVADAEHRFRQRIRQASRETDETVENGDPLDIWDEVVAVLRDVIADAASGVVRELEAGADRIAGNIVELLNEEALAVDPVLGRATPVDVGRFWTGIKPEHGGVGQTAGMGWATLRGAQGGILVLGMMGSLAGIALSTGMLLGIGAIFGGKQLFEERRRQLTQRRQKARTAIRQFLDDVQFEVGKSMRDVSRELQRQLRDHFSERIGESVRSCAAASESLQKNLQEDEAVRARRSEALRRDIAGLTAIRARMQASAGATQ